MLSQILNLSGNELSRIPKFRNGLKIFFGENPLHCDCALANRAMELDSIEGAFCRNPSSLEGIEAKDLTENNFGSCGMFGEQNNLCK